MIELQGRIGGRQSITAQIKGNRNTISGQVATGGGLSGQMERGRNLSGSIATAGMLTGQLSHGGSQMSFPPGGVGIGPGNLIIAVSTITVRNVTPRMVAFERPYIGAYTAETEV